MKRRKFLSIAGSVIGLDGASQGLDISTSSKNWWTQLGQTGIRVPRLSIGTGTNGWGGSSAQTRLGLASCVRLLHHAYDEGITWWDAADQYGSHRHIREALKRYDRETVVITTKTVARSAQQARQDLDRFLKELGTDYIDILLLHCLVDPNWTITMRPIMEVLTDAKEKGRVRALGVSCHDYDALKAATEEPWVEVILARLNYSGVHMDGSPQQIISLLSKAQSNGKGIYGMKVMGQGQLGSNPERAINFVFHSGVVSAITIGMISEKEIKDNSRRTRSLFPKTA
ncbi:MAG: aldo/keto reductase [Armatimonadetes bacterium]|nr:aldo/keto reductase [Armatimonadota bacterium]MDW8121204.1 aldo/keto reductase [Armatimonadota bacterium]